MARAVTARALAPARASASAAPPASRSAAGKFISIRGAREHNLKGVDLDLPRDSLIVMTGLSGSGKPSP